MVGCLLVWRNNLGIRHYIIVCDIARVVCEAVRATEWGLQHNFYAKRIVNDNDGQSPLVQSARHLAKTAELMKAGLERSGVRIMQHVDFIV